MGDETARLVVLAALPQEYAPLKRMNGPWRSMGNRGRPMFIWTGEDVEVVLLETGMGRKSICKVLHDDLMLSADLLLSVGFAGGLCPDLAVGDVLVGDRFVQRERMEPGAGDGGRCFGFAERPALAHFFPASRSRWVQVVTVEEPESKQDLSRSLGDTPGVMEMETYHVARFAQQQGVPFLSVRAVSDGLYDEIDFDLGSITDSAGRVRIGGVLAAILRRPQLVRSFYGSWRRSSLAARKLAEFLSPLLHLSADQLKALSMQCRIEPTP